MEARAWSGARLGKADLGGDSKEARADDAGRPLGLEPLDESKEGRASLPASGPQARERPSGESQVLFEVCTSETQERKGRGGTEGNVPTEPAEPPESQRAIH